MGLEVPLPDVGPLGYLLGCFLDMKIATSREYGLEPRSWAEVLAFSNATGRAQESWERQVLFDMSWEYVMEFNKAANPFLKSPMERST